MLDCAIVQSSPFIYLLGTLPGEIINWVALDREQHSQHSLKVMVTDQGHPRLNATANVHILVTDVNDNAPQFTHLPATKELNIQVNVWILRLHWTLRVCVILAE